MPVKARSGNYVVINHTHVATSNLVHKLGLGLAYQKRRLRRKLARVWLGKHIKSWTPYVFLQQLKLATSNLVYNLGLGLSYQKQRLGPKLAGGRGWEKGASEKIWDPLFISATVKASD